MANTLGLYGDLDDVELLMDIESSFSLTITAEMSESMLTVGDIHDAVLEKLRVLADGRGGCATAMAFYRLRRALRLEGRAGEIRTDTDLSTGPWPSVRCLSERMRCEFGLKLPGPVTTWQVNLGFVAVLCCIAGLLLTGVPEVQWWMPLMFIGLGALLMRFDPLRLSNEFVTVGQLATRVAKLNPGPLALQGAALRLPDVWDDLVEVLAEHTELPKSEIRPDTLLLQSQADKRGSRSA